MQGCFDRRGSNQGNPVRTLGSQGCAPQLPAAERGSWLCQGPPSRLRASQWTQAPRDLHLSTPGALKLRGCSRALYVLTPLLDKGRWADSECQLVCFFWSQGLLDEIQSGVQTYDALTCELICSNNAFVNLRHQRGKKNLCKRASFRGSLWKQAIWLHCSAFVNSPAYYCFPAGWHMLNLSHI